MKFIPSHLDWVLTTMKKAHLFSKSLYSCVAIAAYNKDGCLVSAAAHYFHVVATELDQNNSFHLDVIIVR